MPRGPSYTSEEMGLMTELAKDKTMSHSEKVDSFFAKVSGPSDRTPDAISQKIRKLESEKKPVKKVKAAGVAAPAAAPAKRGPGRPPKAAKTATAAVAGNGHKNGNGHGHNIEVALGEVTLRGPAAKVGALLTQLSA
jgi:hypothetical protein